MSDFQPEFDYRFQRHFAAYLLRDTEVLKLCRNSLEPEKFSNDTLKALVRLINAFYDQYGTAPDELILPYINDYAVKGLVSDGMQGLLLADSQELLKERLQNKQYVIESYGKTLQHFAFQPALLKAAELGKKGEFAAAIDHINKEMVKTSLVGVKEVKEPFPIEDAAELDATTEKVEYYIADCIAKGHPTVVGAPSKTMKTTCVNDAFIAIAHRAVEDDGQLTADQRRNVRFLDYFPVLQGGRVLYCDAETPKPVKRDCCRQQCQARKFEFKELKDYYYYTRSLPQFDSAENLRAFERMLERIKPDLVASDCAMFSFGDAAEKLGNLAIVAPMLDEFADICLKHGATPIIVHHTNSMRYGDIPTLENLSWAGFKQWASQWILFNRRELYVPGTGTHKLVMATGGRAGHGVTKAITIDEGIRDSVRGRYWSWPAIEILIQML